MKYRQLSPTGDYQFGHGQADFFVNNANGVAQLILTRLKLFQGEWFLDFTQGTPWEQEIVAVKVPQVVRDTALQTVITQTQGVNNLLSYSSLVDPNTRNMRVAAIVNTIFGPVSLAAIVGPTIFQLDVSQIGGSDSLG